MLLVVEPGLGADQIHLIVFTGGARRPWAASPSKAIVSTAPGQAVPGGSSGQSCPAQRASGDDTPGVQGQQSEQNLQLAAAYADRVPRLVTYLQRA